MAANREWLQRVDSARSPRAQNGHCTDTHQHGLHFQIADDPDYQPVERESVCVAYKEFQSSIDAVHLSTPPLRESQLTLEARR
jgi:hypothetical protein